MRMRRELMALLTMLLGIGSVGGTATEKEYDVVVYGGTASGVIAGVAAAREGSTVAILEPGKYLGGMVSGGLGATDAGRSDTIGGIAREYFARLGAHYGRGRPVFRHEPGVAEALFHEMVEEAGVDLYFEHRLVEGAGVEMSGESIERVRLENGAVFRAGVFIDASYEGDLMAQAGVSYHVGRESRETYGESLAGVRRFYYYGPPDIASDEEGLLPDIYTGPPGESGSGDGKIQAYNFRLCLTRDPENRVEIGRPDSYDPRRYTLLARTLLSRPGVTLGSFLSIGEVPNGKTDVNNIGSLSTDHIGANWEYPDGDYATRERIWKDHRAYVHGLLYFLGNDPRVPENVRAEMREWGFAADEFVENSHWPHQMYIRVARRMIGDSVMTERDVKEEITKPDSIGMGSYMLDSHFVQRVLTKKGVGGEGSLGGDHRVFPYEIGYGSLVPRREECDNLLVPIAMSASHVAYSSIRMEPVYMIMGHSAGVAAAMAEREGKAVQEIDYVALRAKLEEQEQVLSFEIEGRIDPKILAGIVIQETDARQEGTWYKSTSGEPFVGLGYMHDNNVHKGRRIAHYEPEFPEAGRYKVWLYFAPAGNRAGNVPVTVRHADGEKRIVVNQRERFPGEDQALLLGTFRFEKGRGGEVEISNEGTDGVVVADTVQFVAVNEPDGGQRLKVSDATERVEGDGFSEDGDVMGAVRRCRDFIRAAQLPDGALRMGSGGDGVRIVPYFSNIAAMALLAAHEVEPAAADLERVRDWLLWYARHQEPDGTIQDYSGTIEGYKRLDHRDSTDSYAATFLMALWRYAQAGGDSAFDRRLVRAANGAVDAIALTFDEEDGLTWAKPGYRVKFLMDNLEVAMGLKEGAEYFRAAGEEAAMKKAMRMLRGVTAGLPQFWLPEKNHFAWAKGSSGAMHVGFDRWYPDGVVNIFGLAHTDPPPAGLWEKLQKTFSDDPRLTPDWWARAAWRAGNPEEQAVFLNKSVAFAFEMTERSHQINRFGTTIFALLGKDAQWPAISYPTGVAEQTNARKLP